MSLESDSESVVGPDTKRRISGRFVGDNLSTLPGISAYGALLRIARLNHLCRQEFYAALRLRMMRRDDISRVLTFSIKRKEELALALGVDDEGLALWDISAWLPFTGNLVWDCLPWEPRICPCCARLGFHTLLFQLPWVARCPWHGAHLIQHCRRCARPLSAASDDVPLSCPCGADFVSVREACRYRQSHLRDMGRWIGEYLDWAASSRKTTYLVHTPNADASNWEALGQLIEMPAALRIRCGHVGVSDSRLHERKLTLQSRAIPKSDVVSPKFLLDVPVAIDDVMEIPQVTWGAFRAVGYELAEKLPDATFSDGELFRFLAGSRGPKSDFSAANRSDNIDILFLPVQVGGERGFLCVNALAKAARDVAYRIGQFLEGFADTQGLAVHAGILVLLRAYSEGMRVILSRSIPALFEMKRDRPRLTVPWVLLYRHSGQVLRTKIVWASRNDDCQAALTPSIRNKPRRSAQAPLGHRKRGR